RHPAFRPLSNRNISNRGANEKSRAEGVRVPDLPTLVLFATACLALTATPGPDMLLIASRSVGQGPVSGFATLAGIQIGTYGHALAAAFGLSQLFVAVPLAYDVVRYA